MDTETKKILRVDLLSARRLAPMNKLSSTSDPYVKLSLDDTDLQKSKTIKKTLDPEWHERFMFEIVNMKQTLICRVFDWEAISHDNFMGQVAIPLADFGDDKKMQDWYQLRDENKRNAQGQIHLVMEICDATQEELGVEKSGKKATKRLKEKATVLSSQVKDLTIENRNLGNDLVNAKEELGESLMLQEKLRAGLVQRREQNDIHERELEEQKKQIEKMSLELENANQISEKYKKEKEDLETDQKMIREKLSYYQNPELKPLWHHKSDFVECERCGERFTLFRRKKNCHKCGAVVCKKCLIKGNVSNYKKPVVVCSAGCPEAVQYQLVEVGDMRLSEPKFDLDNDPSGLGIVYGDVKGKNSEPQSNRLDSDEKSGPEEC